MRAFSNWMGCLFLVLGTSTLAHAQSCVDGMVANMQQMAQNALQCGESAEAIGSITENGMSSGRFSADELSMMCGSGDDVNSQLNAFNECSRVYVCAVAAYSYAIENIDTYGGDCTAAAQAGLDQFPVR